MRRATRDQVTGHHSRDSKPQFTVAPGEVFQVETELCTGDWLHSLEDIYAPEKATAANPTVVIAVEGAMPGDDLRVHIHGIEPDALGYTGFIGGSPLANSIIDRDWGQNTRTVRIEDGFVHFSPTLRLKVNPMIGTLGTAPADAAVDNTRGGRHGGNMDAQQVRAGAVITLPVEVEGALLHIGDVHAIQGDGEINGAGGIECRSLVTLHVEVVPRPARAGCVRAEDEERICAIACEGDIENCCVVATRELLYWLCDGYGIDEGEAYLLLGQAMGLHVTQLVNPTRTVAATFPKALLPR